MTVKEMRWVDEIGMFAVDRPVNDVGETRGSCVHATDYCYDNCYNTKLYRIYPAMRMKDIRNEAEWQSASAEDYAQALDRKRKPTNRWRLMTRGEALADHADIDRVKALAIANPSRLLWVPTRAWRDPMLRIRIETELFAIRGNPLPNLVVLASLDPTTDEHRADLASAGWSTMFFGDDTRVDGRFRCPKTFRGLSGHCGICKAGCFAPAILGRRVDVILSQH